MVLNKKRIKLIKGKTLFTMEGACFSLINFQPKNSIESRVINMRANVPILKDINILGFCYIR